MAENTEIESLKREFENAAAELKEAKDRDATGSGRLLLDLRNLVQIRLALMESTRPSGLRRKRRIFAHKSLVNSLKTRERRGSLRELEFLRNMVWLRKARSLQTLSSRRALSF